VETYKCFAAFCVRNQCATLHTTYIYCSFVTETDDIERQLTSEPN